MEINSPFNGGIMKLASFEAIVRARSTTPVSAMLTLDEGKGRPGTGQDRHRTFAHEVGR